MTAKRFIIFQDYYDDLYIQDKEVYRATGIKVGNEEDVKYENVSKIVELLNELNDENEQLKYALNQRTEQCDKYYQENEQLKKAIAETEKMVQSTYDELTKLRCFKKNILRIKHSWDYLMEAIQYD